MTYTFSLEMQEPLYPKLSRPGPSHTSLHEPSLHEVYNDSTLASASRLAEAETAATLLGDRLLR